MYLKIWDVGGQLSLRRLWQSYYGSCHAIIFVVDCSDVGEGEGEGRGDAGGWLVEGGGTGKEEGGGGGGGLGDGEKGWDGDDDSERRRGRRTSAGIGTRKAGPGSGSGPDPESESESKSKSKPNRAAAGNPSPLTTPSTTTRLPPPTLTPSTTTAPHHPLTRLQECRLVLESVLASTDTTGIPILVLANKQDREDCFETVTIKEKLVRPVFEGEKGGGVRDSRVLPVSALTGTGVREAVEWVRSRVRWNREGRAPVLR